jgi:hypothetical protein
MASRTFALDSGNAARLAARIIAIDSGNAARVAKRIFVVDSGNVARLIYQGTRQLTITSATSGTIKGYQRGSFGTLTADISGPSTSGLSDFSFFNNSSGPSAQLAIDGFGADPGQSWFTTATANSVALASSSATYGFAGTRATWTWSGSTWGMVTTTSYTLVLT